MIQYAVDSELKACVNEKPSIAGMKGFIAFWTRKNQNTEAKYPITGKDGRSN